MGSGRVREAADALSGRSADGTFAEKGEGMMAETMTPTIKKAVAGQAVSYSFITSYWLQEVAVFKKNLAILRKGHDTEALHDFRVAVKKLRATIEYYIQLTGEPLWENPFAETEDLFQVGGRERDTETCLILLKKHRAGAPKRYNGLLHHLHQVLQQTRAWSAEAFRAYHVRELDRFSSLLKSEDAALHSPVLADKAVSLVLAGIREAHSLYRKPHRLRQHLKKVFYWLKTLPPGTPAAGLESKLHDALDELGAWQDNTILLARIKHFRKDVLPQPLKEQKELTDLSGRIEEENAKKRRKALLLIRELNRVISR